MAVLKWEQAKKAKKKNKLKILTIFQLSTMQTVNIGSNEVGNLMTWHVVQTLVDLLFVNFIFLFIEMNRVFKEKNEVTARKTRIKFFKLVCSKEILN